MHQWEKFCVWFTNNVHIKEHSSQIISIMTSVIYQEQRKLPPAFTAFGGLNNGANTSNLTSANVSKSCCVIYLKCPYYG